MNAKNLSDRPTTPTLRRRDRRAARRPAAARGDGYRHVEQLEERALLSHIFGQVFDDANGDGLRGVGEAGIGGAEVQLLKFNVADGTSTSYRTATTDAQGLYAFGQAGDPSVPAGDYLLQLPSAMVGMDQTYPSAEHAPEPYFLRIDSNDQTIGAWPDAALTDPSAGWIDAIPSGTQTYFLSGDFLFQFGPQGVAPSRVSLSGTATVNVDQGAAGDNAAGVTLTDLQLNGIVRSDQHEQGYQGPLSLTLSDAVPSTGAVTARNDYETTNLADGTFEVSASIDTPASFGLTSALTTQTPIGYIAREIARFPAFGHTYAQRGTEPPIPLVDAAGQEQGQVFFSSMTPTPGADFGVFRTSAISGHVFRDADPNDGAYNPDAGDQPLAGRQVTIQNLGTELDTGDTGGSGNGGTGGPPAGKGESPAAPITLLTGVDGSYSLGDLGPGYYKVTERIAPPWQPTVPAGTESSYTIHLLSGTPAVADFGNVFQAGGVDYGDAPDSYGTRSASNGASHDINDTLWLGQSVDSEQDGQPGPAANGDDSDGNNDDDGVHFDAPLIVGRSTTLTVVASAPGKLSAWIDLDGNGAFNPSDQVLADVELQAGTNEVPIEVLGTAATGDSYARFRFSTDAGLGPNGPASDGEVEDYAVHIYGADQLGSVVGQVVEDLNGDGLRGPTEHGLDGWTVELVTLDGSVVATTVSATAGGNAGIYRLDTVVPGTYEVRETPPQSEPAGPPWLQTAPADDETGAVNYIVDVPAGQVGAEPTVIAADDGTTGWLAAAAPGTDVMPISAQINLLTGGGGAGHAGEPLHLSLFGDAAITRLSDQAIDSNGDGVLDTVPATFDRLDLSGYVEVSGTEGAPGVLTGPVTVTLLAPAQGRFGPPSTGESTAGIEGSFNLLMQIDLTALGMGVFTSNATPVAVSGGVLQLPYVGTDFAREGGGPPIQFTNATGDIYRLVSAHLTPTYGVDFGNFQTVTVSGSVYDDQNLNGTRDEGEPGLAGATVTVSYATAEEGPETEHGSGGQGGQGSNGQGGEEETDPEVFITLTDADGNWTVSDLGPGPYTVTIVPPGAFQAGSGNAADLTTTVDVTSGVNPAAINAAVVQRDYGDAPAPYPSTLADDGASHVVSGGFSLGTLNDGETDALPVDASDDGIAFASMVLRPGKTTDLVASVSAAGGPAYLDAWVDFNADGDWSDTGEHVISQAVTDGSNALSFVVPTDAVAGATTYARFRLSRGGGLDPTGAAAAGEVEDYRLTVNTPPVGVADAYPITEDTPLVVDASQGVLANDTDVEGDALTATLVDGPAHGTLAFNPDGSFTYTPSPNYHGTDSFTYTVSDGTAESLVATEARITVLPVNDAPVSAGDAYATDEDVPLVIDAASGVLANDSDVEGDALSAVLVAAPSHGTLALNADGSFTYTPAADYNGTDSFVYRADDGTDTGVPATVTITINPVADAPRATVTSDGPVDEGSPVTVAVTDAVDPDAVDATFRYSFALEPAGLASVFEQAGTAPSASFTFADDGTYTIYARVFDSNGGVTDKTLSVVVRDVAPTLTAPAAQSAEERSVATIDLGALADPGADAPWTITVNWGDGSTESFAVDQAGPLGARSHRYLLDGTFAVSVTATDAKGVAAQGSIFDVIVAPAPVTPGDYSGDGLGNLAVYSNGAAGGGRFDIRGDAGAADQVVMLGQAGDVPVSGDFDGDGKLDVAVFRPMVDSDGDGIPDAAGWTIVESSTGNRREVLFGAPGMMDLPAPADYDGDGKTDIATFRPDSDLLPGAAHWFILPSGGGSAYSVAFGASGMMDQPAPADYDGDGKADIATYRPESDLVPGAAQWFILPSGTNSAYSVVFGAPGMMDQPVPADYDGDGKADIATFRSDSDLIDGSHWFILGSASQAGQALASGPAGSIAAPGDYDGDGKVDPASFNAGDAGWTIHRSSTGQEEQVTFGPTVAHVVPVGAPLISRLLAVRALSGDGAGTNATTADAPSVAAAYQVIDRAIEDLGYGSLG